MDLLALIAGLFALFWFRNAIKGSASMATTVVEETNRQIEDSIKTYGDDIAIMNANKRSEQFETIQKMENIVTCDDIRSILSAKSKVADQA